MVVRCLGVGGEGAEFLGPSGINFFSNGDEGATVRCTTEGLFGDTVLLGGGGLGGRGRGCVMVGDFDRVTSGSTYV